MATIKFFDSASGAIEPGRRAALYIDGHFRASEAEKLEHPRHRMITVLGDPQASCADYEPGNALYEPGVLRAWATARRALGGHDVVRVYCDRADAAKAAAEVKGIPHLLDVWEGFGHDWHWWRRMAEKFFVR